MQLFLLAASLGFICLFCYGPMARGQEWTGIRKKAAKSIVFLKNERVRSEGGNKGSASSGTAFIISSSGLAVTAGHVIKREDGFENNYVAFSTPTSTTAFPFRVVGTDGDVALIKIEGKDDWVPLDLNLDSPPEEDSKLYALGYPKGRSLSSADGLLSSKSTGDDTWQTTLPLNLGNSGGPVFDLNGCVIGVVSQKVGNAEGISLVAPISYLKRIALGRDDVLLSTPQHCATQPRERKIQDLRLLAEGMLVPKGTVAAFALKECPKYWDEFKPAAGRVVLGSGSGVGLTTRDLLQDGGAETHLLTEQELPKHQHQVYRHAAGEETRTGKGAAPGYVRGAGDADSNTWVKDTNRTGIAGADVPFTVMPPFIVLTMCQKS